MKRLMVSVALTVFGGSICSVQAADLFRHRGYHHAARGPSAYADDSVCQTFEPTEYAPRTTNFHQPLCYAARPYGISQHLYDYSTLLRGSRDDIY